MGDRLVEESTDGRYALRDDQWERIKDFLLGREEHMGGTLADIAAIHLCNSAPMSTIARFGSAALKEQWLARSATAR